MKDYVLLLRNPRAARPFAAAVLARLPISMAPLGLVLLVETLRDSYSLAGVVTGAFAVGVAVGSPAWGRALDTYGQPRVITTSACTSAAFLLALTVATAHRGVPAVVLVALAVLVGLTFPPVSPAMRAAWRVALPDPRQQRLGYALDASAVETLFVTGPLLLTLILAVGPAVAPMLVTVVILAGGAVLYSRTAAARASRPAPRERPVDAGRPPATRPVAFERGIPTTLVVLAAMSVGFGLLDVSLAGLAEQVLGSSDKLGYLFAGIAGGSAIGGLVYGNRQWRAPERLRVPVSLGGFGLMLVVLASAAATDDPPMGLLVPVLFATGLFIAPNLIVLQSLVDDLAPSDRLGEAQAWLSTAVTSGAAVGNALAGLLIDRGGPRESLAVAAVAVLAATGIALLAQPRWRAVLTPSPAAGS